MVYKRLIPVVLIKHGMLVRSQEFKVHQVIGNPISTIHRYSSWDVDELVLLDISREGDFHELRRNDIQVEYDGKTFLDVIKAVSPVCSMPLTVGGRINSLSDIRERLELGADKCVINTAALNDPSFIEQCAKTFGSQCITVGIDVKKNNDGSYSIWKNGGLEQENKSVLDWVKEIESLGAGEIFLNSIDRDGTGLGYDTEIISKISSSVDIPVIACGGVGKYSDFDCLINDKFVSGIAAANIFHFRELSYTHAKDHCLDKGASMRTCKLDSKWFSREPIYNFEKRNEKISKTLNYQPDKHEIKPNVINSTNIKWCSKCVAPSISAVPLEFDDEGVCTACQMAERKSNITTQEWEVRKNTLISIVDKYRSKDASRYDCVVGVSGGKDSYFQVHYLKNVLGLNPLLVTYDGNNWLEVGWRNMLKMKEVFNCDHIIYSPQTDLLKKLNRLGFIVMGDMNWHGHMGISTVPMKVAALHKIPLVFYGEHGYTELGGQFSLLDFPEVSYRYRQEHFGRNYEWNYFVGLEDIASKDMIPYKYPTDSEIYSLDLRGLFLGNYIYWDANKHTPLVIEKYGFEVSKEKFDRTYRTMSNLDDMHENGLHDYLKYVKFGYGRCTDHVCKDIREGLLTREEGIALVKKYDHVFPRDIIRWSKYTGISKNEFERIADSFRDPRVWWKEDGKWVKQNIWD
jgi:imidazoleglycerol phosphate synthase cyclase subunit